MTSEGADAQAIAASPVGLAAGRGVWVVLPTYNERDNVEGISAAILAALPEAELLIVDDNSPGRHRRPGRHDRRARATGAGPAPARQGRAWRRLPPRVPLGARPARA